MAAVGGSIESIDIRGRLFPVAADADGNRKVGGFENEIQSNGDGTARIIKTRVPWMLDGITVEVSDDRADHEFLQEVANENDFVAIGITYASGATWSGRGMIVGELQYSSQNATCELSLSGPQDLTQQ